MVSNGDLANFMTRLKGLFPQAELTPEEAELWARRMRHADFRAAVSALEDHKVDQDGHNRRRPSLGAVLKAIAVGSATKREQRPAPTLADVIRLQRPELHDCGDVEVLLRHWRADWRAYSTRAAQRREPMNGHSTPPAGRGPTLRAHDRQTVGYRRKVRLGCTGSLIAAGMEQGLARRYALAVVKSDPDTFRRVLEDARLFAAMASTAAA
jgi:hypothetical protein